MESKLEKIREQVTDCKKCDLWKTRTNAVPGKGNFHSDVVFIGEAPGRSEDNKGEPFIGAAGKKLSLALETAGIKREEVYITNVVKCRPPNNRIPNVEEKKTCKDYLEKEISIIKPKIICILGNTAFNSLLGGSEITKFRGKTIQREGQIYFLTIHPAATIYNQELIYVLKKDMIKLFELIKAIKNNETIKIDIESHS